MFGFHSSWQKTLDYFRNNLSGNLDGWHTLAESLGVEITEEVLWEEMRKSEDPPELHNVYQYELLKRIEFEVLRRYPELNVETFVNAADTHLHINKVRITSLVDFEELIESLEYPEAY